MNIRLIEIIFPKTLVIQEEITGTLKENGIEEYYISKLDTKALTVKFLVRGNRANDILDVFDKRFWSKEGFKILLYPLEATIPRIEEEEDREEKEETPESSKKSLMNIHREALYEKVVSWSVFSLNKGILYALSTIVAAIGFIFNNTAVIIASMVIAPFLMPNIWLSLWTILSDKSLIQASLKNLFRGVLIAWILSVGIGFFYWSGALFESYWYMWFYMVILSFITGIVAILYLLDNNDSGLVGVMVAISLLPPITLSGMLLGSGLFMLSLQALTVFLTNVVCLNLAGILTFLVAEIHPNSRREEKRAKKDTKKAIRIWGIALLILLILIWFFSL